MSAGKNSRRSAPPAYESSFQKIFPVVKQKFQHQCAAKPPALYLELGKACGQIPLPDVLRPDKPGAAHRLGKAVAPGGIRGGAAVVRAVLAQILAADRLVAAFALGAAEPAALVAQKLHLGLLLRRQGAQLLQCRVQPEIRHHIPELRLFQFLLQLRKLGEHLGSRGYQIQLRPALPQIVRQQIRMDDHAVWHTACLGKLLTQGIALRVGKVLSPQQGVAEGQPSGDAVFPQQRQHLARSCPAAGDASPAPDAARRGTVDRADGAPVVKIFPVLPVQRQKAAVQLVKLEQAGQMITGCCGLFHSGSFPAKRELLRKNAVQRLPCFYRICFCYTVTPT